MFFELIFKTIITKL